jgi:probable HAF family extracellular repeat protein
MRKSISGAAFVSALFALGGVAFTSVAVGTADAAAAPAPPHYRLIDLGTLGGPQGGIGNAPVITENGIVASTADTGQANPYGDKDNPFFGGDPFVQHGRLWQQGTIVDLGALGPASAGNSSWAAEANAAGHAAGISDDGNIDSQTGFAEAHAVAWKHGQITDLGTLGGRESVAFDLNDADQVVGTASNTIPDHFSINGWPTQTRAVLWQTRSRGRHPGGRKATKRDLGTLGGPDAWAGAINRAGQVAGFSYKSALPNAATGIPTQDPFLWRHGHMIDLGTLGGTVGSPGEWHPLNDAGDVVGQSNLPGDQIQHPFLWHGKHLIDLGTFGGDNGSANSVNDVGDVTGRADLPDGTHHGFLWREGQLRPLRPLPGAACSSASWLNNRNQVVGNSSDCHGNIIAANLWQNGITYDLNSLVAPSQLHLRSAITINNRGEITGEGVLPDGNRHDFLLIPDAT